MSKWHFLVHSFIVFLPWFIRRRVLEKFFGYRFGKKARIGFSWVFPKYLIMGDHARIGNLTVAIHVNRVEMGNHATIGRQNWITGHEHGSQRFSHRDDRDSALVLGQHSAITKSHIIDCTDRVVIGDFTTIAGYSSQFITHGIDINCCRQDCKPIEIGSYCLVGSRTICLGGGRLPDYSVLGAGSALTKALNETNMLYAGSPARAVKKLDPAARYFQRENGFVW